MLSRRRCCCGAVTVPTTCAACFPGSPPGPLTLTDDNATITLGWIGTLPFTYRWGGNYAWSTTGVQSVSDPGTGTLALTTGAITMDVGYTVNCSPSGGVLYLDVNRSWRTFDSDEVTPQHTTCSGVAGAVVSYWTDNAIAANTYCTTVILDAQPVNVGTGLIGGFHPSSCSPLSASGTLNTPTAPRVDPAPGTVLITSTTREQMEGWLGSGDPKKRRHARYKIMVMDDPRKMTGHLTRDGEFIRGPDLAVPAMFVMPAPDAEEDRKLREYLGKHGGCCGGPRGS